MLTHEQWVAFNTPVAVELKKGECTFHHPLMVHGSFANRTERPRRAAVINAFRDGTRSDSDEPLLAGVPPTPRAGRWAGSSSRCCSTRGCEGMWSRIPGTRGDLQAGLRKIAAGV